MDIGLILDCKCAKKINKGLELYLMMWTLLCLSTSAETWSTGIWSPSETA